MAAMQQSRPPACVSLCCRSDYASQCFPHISSLPHLPYPCVLYRSDYVSQCFPATSAEFKTLRHGSVVIDNQLDKDFSVILVGVGEGQGEAGGGQGCDVCWLETGVGE